MRLNIPIACMYPGRFLHAGLLAAVTALTLVGVARTQEPVSPDGEALVALYNSTDGENWSVNTNWLSDEPVDSRHGVTTNGEGRVRRIDLENNRLSGPLPPALGSLSAPEYLRLGNNRLIGQIPTELGNLSNLQLLSFSGKLRI